MTARPLRLLLAGVAAGAMLLSGCGGSDDADAAPASSAASSAAAGAPASSSAAEASSTAGVTGTYPIPAGYGLTELALPPGVEGSESNVVGRSFGFYIFDADPEMVLDFYEQSLSAAGFRISPNMRELDAVSASSDTALVDVAVVTPDTIEVSVAAP